ncbi:hypothetical protein DOT_0364 [Desulfosporosinus sp. OT]|nr:hypothetical protein DOT_0364 [Desulfosporosinus sp. OT]
MCDIDFDFFEAYNDDYDLSSLCHTKNKITVSLIKAATKPFLAKTMRLGHSAWIALSIKIIIGG